MTDSVTYNSKNVIDFSKWKKNNKVTHAYDENTKYRMAMICENLTTFCSHIELDPIVEECEDEEDY